MKYWRRNIIKTIQYARENRFSSKTQSNLIKNQNSLKISATIVKENNSQQKYDKIRNVKYHNIKERKMPNRLPSTFSNPAAQKKGSGPLYCQYVEIVTHVKHNCNVTQFSSCIKGAAAQWKSFPGCNAMQLGHHTIPILQEEYCDTAGIHVGINDLLNSSSKKILIKFIRGYD